MNSYNKNIALFTNAPIVNDGRVKKMIRLYADYGRVDVFYPDGTALDHTLFPQDEVRLFSYQSNPPRSAWSKLKRSVLLWDHYLHYLPAAEQTEIKYDWIVANDLPTLKPAALLKQKIKGSKLIYDSHEIYLETVNQLYPQKATGLKGMVYQLLIWITRWIGFFVERKLVHQTDYFITVNESLARYFEKQYGIKKVYSVKNCPLKLPAPPKEKIPNIRALYGLPDNAILLLYQGMINPGRALELFIPSLKHAPNHIHFFMIGDGYLKVDLEALIKKEGLSHKVYFLGYIPHEELACYTHAFDYGVNMGGGNLSKNLGLSNKLFEYMHAGIPVLCSRNPENEAIFNEFEMGVLVENEESSILRGLELLVKSDRYSYYSDNCLRAADKYNWERESEIIRKVLI